MYVIFPWPARSSVDTNHLAGLLIPWWPYCAAVMHVWTVCTSSSSCTTQCKMWIRPFLCSEHLTCDSRFHSSWMPSSSCLHFACRLFDASKGGGQVWMFWVWFVWRCVLVCLRIEEKKAPALGLGVVQTTLAPISLASPPFLAPFWRLGDDVISSHYTGWYAHGREASVRVYSMCM